MKLIPENADELIVRIKAKPLVLYGMGYVGKLIAEWCDSQAINYVFVDRDADKKRAETDKTIIIPERLAAEYLDANIVITSINYYEEIRGALNEMGVKDARILSYMLFWPQKIAWHDLEESVDWELVRQRAEKFAEWIGESTGTVADYSADRNYLKEFLPPGVNYYSPNYIRIVDNAISADFSSESLGDIRTDASSCIAVLMGFINPEAVIRHICETTKKTIILSYVALEKLPDINLRRSINYVNDYTEMEIITMLSQYGFLLRKKETDPFDEVHTVYLFEKRE